VLQGCSQARNHGYWFRLRNDLYCVEWGVKLYSLTHSLTDIGMQPYVAQVCTFNGLHPRNLCKNIDYYSFTDPRGMEG